MYGNLLCNLSASSPEQTWRIYITLKFKVRIKAEIQRATLTLCCLERSEVVLHIFCAAQGFTLTQQQHLKKQPQHQQWFPLSCVRDSPSVKAQEHPCEGSRTFPGEPLPAGCPNSFLHHQGAHFSLEAASMPCFHPPWS